MGNVIMSKDDYREEMERRWRESMALLGLDDGPPPKAEAAPKPAPPPPKLEPARKVEDSPPVLTPEPVTMPDFSASDTQSEIEDGGVTPVIDMPVVGDELPPGDDDHEPGQAPEPPGPDDKSRRRRGRRGRRGKRPEDAPKRAAAGEAVSSEGVESPSEPADERRGRGQRPARDQAERPRRGRGKPAPEREPEPVDEDEPIDAENQPAFQEDGLDDGDPPDLSEWDVPSWQELIASLHRPDR
jgi:hypothetical protein